MIPSEKKSMTPAFATPSSLLDVMAANEQGHDGENFLEINGMKVSKDNLRAWLQRPRDPREQVSSMEELEARVAEQLTKLPSLATPSESSSTPRLFLGTAEGNDAFLSGRGYSVRLPNGKFEVRIKNPAPNSSRLVGPTSTLSDQPRLTNDEHEAVRKPASIPSALKDPAPTPFVKRRRIGDEPRTMGKPASIPSTLRDSTPIPPIDLLEINDEPRTIGKPASIPSAPKSPAPTPFVKRRRIGHEPQEMGKPASIPSTLRDSTPIPPIDLLEINDEPQTIGKPASNLSAPKEATPTQSLNPLQTNEKPETGKVPATEVSRFPQHHLRSSTEASSVSERFSERYTSQSFEPSSERQGVIIMQPRKPAKTESNDGISVESEVESELSTIDSDELEDLGLELGLLPNSSSKYPCDSPLPNNSPSARALKRQKKSHGSNRKVSHTSLFGQVEVSGKKRSRAVAFPDEFDEEKMSPVPYSSPNVGALKGRKKGIASSRAATYASLSGQLEVKGKKRSRGEAFAEEVDEDNETEAF
jgi:hypothetical protein